MIIYFNSFLFSQIPLNFPKIYFFQLDTLFYFFNLLHKDGAFSVPNENNYLKIGFLSKLI